MLGKVSAVVLLAFSCIAIASGQTKATYANDDFGTGWYRDQPLLDPATVSGPSFGKLFDKPVVGQVYAQPLVSNNVLLVATEQNWIYGFDPVNGNLKWSRNVGKPWNVSDIGCSDLTPTIGITGTPVIDSTTGTAYFLKKTYVNGTSGPGSYWMHAVDIATGLEKPNFPVLIAGNAQNDTASVFEATKLMNRPALLLMDGVVYAGFGALCDIGPYKGWIVGVSTSGQIKAMWTAVQGIYSGGGIWHSGGGLVSDGPGRIFCATGNGFDSTPNGVHASTDVPAAAAQSLVRLAVQPNGSLKADNFFAPYDALALDTWDADLGSGSPVALPAPWFGTPSMPKLMVTAGKQGYVYLLNRDDLGGQKMGPGGADAVVSRIGPYGGVWSRPAVWPGDGGYIYMPTGSSGPSAGPTSGLLRAYKYGLDGSGKPSLSLSASSAEQMGGYSSAPLVTSDGLTPGSALVWVNRVPDGTGNGSQLLAYEAAPNNGQLVLRFAAPIGQGSKFTPPGVGPARIYVGTRDGHLLGFGVPATAPVTAPLTNFGSVVVGESASSTVTLTASTEVTIQSLSASNTQFQVGAAILPASLDRLDTLVVPITFKPAATGLVTGTLRVVTNLGALEFSLSGSGRETGPRLQISPAVLSLGGASVGQTLIGTATLSNTGGQALTITNIIRPGTPFSLSGAPVNNTQIAPGQSVTVTVQFTPASVGSFTDEIQISTTGGNAEIMLSGSATLPASLSISTLDLNFGSINVNASSTLSFTVANTGASRLAITKSKPPILGPFSAVDTLDEGIILNPGTFKTIRVRFSPSSIGTFTDSWIINSDAPTGLKTVTLTGIGSVSSGGSITGASAAIPSFVTLSDSSVCDWIHWGMNGSQAVNRMKGDAAPQIGELGIIGTSDVNALADHPNSFRWNNGAPTLASDGTSTGIYVWGENNGFKLSAPADTAVRTLNVYVGLWQAQGRLEATLSDGSAPAFVDTSLTNMIGTSVRVYTLTYKAASPGQALSVKWLLNSGPGNVTISAASLLIKAGSLTGAANDSNLATGLDAEGSLDWIHWGNPIPDRKAGTPTQLSSYTLIGNEPLLTYADDPRPLSWRNGTPTSTSSNNVSGIYVPGINNGFSFTAPADRTTRTLVVHAGGWNSSGKLTAHLSDGSAPDFVETSSFVSGQYDRNYTLTYNAGSPGQTLTVTWIVNSGIGNVTLAGAALGCAGGQVSCLAGYQLNTSALVNLTSESNLDWVHWGDAEVNRKAGGSGQLGAFGVIGSASAVPYANDPRMMNWFDGSPDVASVDNRRGVYVGGRGKGFSLTVPATSAPATLYVYVGGYRSSGRFTAELSDGSAAPFVDTTSYDAGQYNRTYAITFRSLAAVQTLKISWVMEDGAGNVTLNAAGLADGSTPIR